jgi:DNA (cytosine-5)-methyltransferase 1
MKTTGSFFTGGGLFDMGAIAAGYTPIWGVEKDEKIAAVARLNGLPVITADVTELDLSGFDRPDHFHASPPCPNFSIAKQDAEETEFDIAMASAVCRALEHFKPDTFTLENVVGYRRSRSFQLIGETLSRLGYWWDATNLNAADFGVPQTRERLWIRASRGLLMGYPAPVKWRGWYEAIEDLIPELPDTEFAPWQMARLPEEYKTFMTGQGTYSPALEPDQPAQTITSNSNQGGIKAFIMQAQGQNGKGYKEEAEPMQTLATTHSAGKYKAFIVGDQSGQIAGPDRPAYTVRSSRSEGTRAFVVSGGNAGANTYDPREADEPHTTITAQMDRTPSRAYTGGRIVKMTVKALGRFQTVPDTYQGLTVKINGNGVPCLMAQRILETLS